MNLWIILSLLVAVAGSVTLVKARSPHAAPRHPHAEVRHPSRPFAAGHRSRSGRSPVAEFDLVRYMGTWYEIARYDHKFERGLEAVQATYTLGPDRRVKVENSGFDVRRQRRSVALGKAHATDVPGRLRVSFFWIFYSDYNVLALGPDYSWALVGSRSPKYLWILSRTPTLPRETLDGILRQARLRGYDTDRLIYVDQSQ